MKPLVRKILESGLIDQHTVLLMEKWGNLDPGASELVGKSMQEASKATLLTFAEELEELLEQNTQNAREQRLGIYLTDPFLAVWEGEIPARSIVVFRNEAGVFIFPTSERPMLETGALFRGTSSGMRWSIVSATPLYVGDMLYAYEVAAIGCPIAQIDD